MNDHEEEKITPYDEECFRLASYFLPDSEPTIKAILAGRLQDTIEQFLSEFGL